MVKIWYKIALFCKHLLPLTQMSSTLIRRGKRHAENAEIRRGLIIRIMENCQRDRRPVTSHHILKELEKQGHAISYRQLTRDRTIINQENSFLGDLGEYNYSAFLEDVLKKLDWVEEEITSLYNTKWIAKKILKRNVGGKEILEQQVTENEAGSKAKFLEIFLHCQKAKLDMFKGDNVDITVDMLSRKMHQLKEENAGLKNQLAKYQNEKPP